MFVYTLLQFIFGGLIVLALSDVVDRNASAVHKIISWVVIFGAMISILLIQSLLKY